MLKCIIVDDELKCRQNLKLLIEDFIEDVQVQALCQNINEATEAIDRNKPDVVFLDIQMQRETGFELLEKIKNINFEVIFTTAYSEYAVKAFKFSAIDYLLKPIDIDELKNALMRIDSKIETSTPTKLEQLLLNLNRNTDRQNFRLVLPCIDGMVFVNTSDILYCMASSNYTNVVMADGKKHIVCRTLKEYEDLLSENDFFRIHNSYLVNLNAIKKYIRGEGGYVVMSNEEILDVSKRKKISFLSKIGLKE